MERFSGRFSEFRLLRHPRYVRDFEVQISRFLSGITYGTREEKLLEDRDRGLLLYHHGPETRVIPGFPATEEPTGKEYVFLEYRHDEDSFHFVGNVGSIRQFTFIRLDRYQKGGYSRVPMYRYREMIMDVTEMLSGMEPHRPADA